MRDQVGLTNQTLTAPAGMVPTLSAAYNDLMGRPLPVGVAGYAPGDSQRDADKAAQVAAGGFSRADFGESPHHYKPALAFDVFPVLPNGDVSKDSTHYAVIGQVAHEHGLEWGGDWGWDFAHVQVPDWRDLAGRPSTPSPLALFAAAAAAALIAVGVATFR